MSKHSPKDIRAKELEKIIARKDKEIKDIKRECAEQFKIIKDMCICNDYNGNLNRLAKIEEVAEDNFIILIKDLAIENEDKIIELHTTRKSNK